MDTLTQRYPKEVSWERLSEDFGVPHPALEQTYACELLNGKPFPTFMGYSSRLLAESLGFQQLVLGAPGGRKRLSARNASTSWSPS